MDKANLYHLDITKPCTDLYRRLQYSLSRLEASEKAAAVVKAYNSPLDLYGNLNAIRLTAMELNHN